MQTIYLAKYKIWSSLQLWFEFSRISQVLDNVATFYGLYRSLCRHTIEKQGGYMLAPSAFCAYSAFFSTFDIWNKLMTFAIVSMSHCFVIFGGKHDFLRGSVIPHSRADQYCIEITLAIDIFGTTAIAIVKRISQLLLLQGRYSFLLIFFLF